ncbi:hypothetical protein CC78DRAFT_573220 [Lojkania enalia]|uniref:Uncharacterized protein n=1 Tax=Lojkania enalia TaxID=147567 RepID=A0A9P4TRQ1_9PLEO|nr:hypothetical protein CC78DRAFT_573220 [Didymosphaeria enalia]
MTQTKFHALPSREVYAVRKLASIAETLEDIANGNILLYLPGVRGIFPNGLLIMDDFANSRYLILGTDYFRSDPIWKHRRHRDDRETKSGFDYEA